MVRFLPSLGMLMLHGVLSVFPAAAQTPVSGEFHEFTSKEGQKVTARILGISADKRQVRILRQDGQEFPAEIVLLSLDDQQYIKDWLKTAPAGSTAPAATYRLEVAATKSLGPSEKHRDDFYTMESRGQFFRLVVRNLSRETLESAVLEYAIVWKDAVEIVFNEDTQEWDYRTTPLDEPAKVVKKAGSSPLEAMRFNGEVALETDSATVDKVLYDGNELYREDELLGIKLRVKLPDGTVLHESDSGGAAIAAMSWDEASGLPDSGSVR